MSLGKILVMTAIALIFCGNLQAGLYPYKYKSIKVLVVDKATSNPVPKTKVTVSYSGDYYFYHPKPESATTDDQGVASVKIAKETSDWSIDAESKGYFYAGIMHLGTVEPELKIIELKKLPEISLTVPNGYVGPIKFPLPKFGSQQNIPRGEYQLQADSTGEVVIEDHVKQENHSGFDQSIRTSFLTASYEDGRPIPLADAEGVTDSTIAMRHLGIYFVSKNPRDSKPITAEEVLDNWDRSRLRQIYIIGTADDQKALLDSIPGMNRILKNADKDE